MADELVLYTNPMSRGRIVRWALEEVGHPYRTELIDYGEPMKAPPFRRVNPMGKVPALMHGETIVTETPAIIAYLADAFPDAGLAPPVTSRARATYYRWFFFAAGPAEAAITNKSLAVVVPDERRGFVGYGSMEAVIDALERAVTPGPYVLGETFSAADIYVGAQIGFTMTFGALEKRPAFTAYWDRLKNRAAYQRAHETDNALLPPERRMPM
jgi:glutathione S-transferase